MAPVPYCQYRSEAAKDECFAWIDEHAAREWPPASESHTVLTSFGPTFTRITGPPHGAPLVLLPGAASCSLMWIPNIAAFSAAHRTFALDRIGDFGKSLCTRPLHDFADLSAWLLETLDALDLHDPVHLAGISYGGALAADFALRHPDRVRRLVLLAPGATVLSTNPALMLRLALAIFDRRRGLHSLMRWLFADAVRQQPAWVDALLAQLDLHMRSTLRFAPMPRVWSDADWSTLRVPTLFLVGEHERIYSPAKALHRLAHVAPGVTAELIPAAGHDLTLVAASAVNRRILAFLASA